MPRSAAALPALLVATALSVHMPPGRTPYGQRRQQEQRTAPQTVATAGGRRSG
ncbi:hypothetical protein [Streptomyces sp. NPDC002133]|uniref:hypothetical protein n=1 Tax=Streptomyces sp. NPDC002133 TaxID=3154409 RepID=UPI0033304947